MQVTLIPPRRLGQSVVELKTCDQYSWLLYLVRRFRVMLFRTAFLTSFKVPGSSGSGAATFPQMLFECYRWTAEPIFDRFVDLRAGRRNPGSPNSIDRNFPESPSLSITLCCRKVKNPDNKVWEMVSYLPNPQGWYSFPLVWCGGSSQSLREPGLTPFVQLIEYSTLSGK